MRVTIRVRPGAGRTAVGGRYGRHALVVRVAAPAVEGRATEAALRALAEALGVRRGDVRLATAGHGRDKVVDVGGGDEELRRRLAELLGPAPAP